MAMTMETIPELRATSAVRYIRTARPTDNYLGRLRELLETGASLDLQDALEAADEIEERLDASYRLAVQRATTAAAHQPAPQLAVIRNGRYRVENADGSSLSIKVEAAGWARDLPKGTRTYAVLGSGSVWDKVGFLYPDGRLRKWGRTPEWQAVRAREALEAVAKFEAAGDSYLLELNYVFSVGDDRPGRCLFCGREINTDESTHVGYGPDCADMRGLPWGENSIGVQEFRARVEEYRRRVTAA